MACRRPVCLCAVFIVGAVLQAGRIRAQMVQIAGVPFAATQVITRTTPDGMTRTEGRIARNTAGSTYVEEIDPASGRVDRILIADVPGKRLITLDIRRHCYTLRPEPALRSRSVPTGWVGDELRWAEAHRNVSEHENTGDVNSTQTWLGTRQVNGLLAVGTMRERRIAASGGEPAAAQAARVDESWFAVELGMSVLMVERQPPTGMVTEVELTGVLRAEPSASLFAIPKDFSPQTEPPQPEPARTSDGA